MSLFSGRQSQRVAGVVAGLLFVSTASALPTLTQGPIGFTGSVSVTDTNPTAGTTTNNNALFGATSFNKFNPAVGVLNKATVTLSNSTRTPSITISQTAPGKVQGKGESIAKLVLPGAYEMSFGSVTSTENCGQNAQQACPKTKVGAPSAANGALSISNPNVLSNDYVGGVGTNFDVTRVASSLSVEVTEGSGTAAYTSTWSGSLQLVYEYLLHASPSFTMPGGDVDSLVIDFGSVLLNSIVAPIGFDIFNLGVPGGLDSDRVGLDLDAITPSGDEATLTADLASFTGLAAGLGRSFSASFDTSTIGVFETLYTMALSDADVGAAATRHSYPLTLTLRGSVVAPAVIQVSAVPAPSTLAFLGLGLVLLGVARRRIA